MCTHREQEESWDSPKSLQNKPMAQRLARSYFILFVILFSSHQKLSIGWQVVSRQFHLGCLSSLSVKGCLSHSFPPFPSLLCIIHHTLRLWQLQKKVEKKNHCVSQIGTCSAHDKVKWTVIYFIFASLSLTCTLFSPLTWFNTPKSHSKADAHCTRVCSPPTDGLTDHYNKHLLWSSLI